MEGLDGVLIGLRTRDLLPALLEAQCRANRVILLLEDIHWIDGASEELLRRLIEGGAQSNLLDHPHAATGIRTCLARQPRCNVACAQPARDKDIKHLVQTRLGVDILPEALIRQVTDRAGGNPLFGEEILSFLMEQGALRIDSGKVDFDAALGESGLPASMQSLLTARMDRLQPQRPGAVAGGGGDRPTL